MDNYTVPEDASSGLSSTVVRSSDMTPEQEEGLRAIHFYGLWEQQKTYVNRLLAATVERLRADIETRGVSYTLTQIHREMLETPTERAQRIRAEKI